LRACASLPSVDGCGSLLSVSRSTIARWLMPEQRLEVPDEEAAKEWREAYYALGDLVQIAGRINQATLTAVMDAQARAEIALERAKARVREASAG
jgi:hypothetical protein